MSVFPLGRTISQKKHARHPRTVIHAIVTYINGIVIMRVNGPRLMSSETKARGQKGDGRQSFLRMDVCRILTTEQLNFYDLCCIQKNK